MQNKSEIKPYKNMPFNSVVIVFDVIIILADPHHLSNSFIIAKLISCKKVSGRICLSPPSEEVGAPKMAIFKIRKFTKPAKLIHFRAECCQKYALDRKRLQIKVPEYSILYEKVSGRISLSQRGARAPQRWPYSKWENVQKLFWSSADFRTL